MKRIFKLAIIAFAAAAVVAACDPKNKPEPEPGKTDDGYAGPVEGTSAWGLVGSLLESNWGNEPGKDYKAVAEGDVYVLRNVKLTASDEFKFRKDGAWTESFGGKFVAVEEPFYVDQGGDNVKPGLEGTFDIYLNLGTSPQINICYPEDTPAWLPQVLTSGSKIVVTNANVQKFLTDVHYAPHDYTKTELRSWAEANSVRVCPGNSDRAAEYGIRWTPDASAGEITCTLTEPTRTWTYTAAAGASYVVVTNMLPNTHYTYEVTAGGKVLTSGQFDTEGLCHQLYIKARIRNCRDLGGWKTQDGKTVKYRMVYRGGRLESSYISGVGKKTIQTEGIKAQLDLRGTSDVLSESTLKGIVDDYAFCAPVIEEGYSQMLRSDKEKTRQCMQFIMDCVDQNKPVYFHCSLGRDRTGTVAMLTLGILGVPEGDISQEYELTQFAPHEYATSNGETVKMTRLADYDGAANVIWEYVNEAAGETFRDGVEKYLIEIGISKTDIDKFRNNMLE